MLGVQALKKHFPILQINDDSFHFERSSQKLIQQLEYTKERMSLYIAKEENKKLKLLIDKMSN